MLEPRGLAYPETTAETPLLEPRRAAYPETTAETPLLTRRTPGEVRDTRDRYPAPNRTLIRTDVAG
ncbi:hypothetical protein [Paenibacillus jilunlii]|uniref:hypothetical protein n=1 Tax=Paenibacillus jilunlii TaxID=682956 RepID=UPI001471766E|nr:hypothetical protein [Paenibacillus jilunlii]